MLVTMLTAMYMMVRAVESLGVKWVRQDPLPYIVSQPLPWQVHCVSRSRRSSSRADEFDGMRRNSMGVYRKNSSASNGQCTRPLSPSSSGSVDKAAVTIQNQYRKYQQKKQKECK